MPLYYYLCEKCGHAKQEVRPIDQRGTPSLCSCGSVLIRDYAREAGATITDWTDPILSDGAGVHPDQVGEARAEAKKHGIPVEYTSDGRAIFTSHTQRKKALKKLGLVDLDGFS